MSGNALQSFWNPNILGFLKVKKRHLKIPCQAWGLRLAYVETSFPDMKINSISQWSHKTFPCTIGTGRNWQTISMKMAVRLSCMTQPRRKGSNPIISCPGNQSNKEILRQKQSPSREYFSIFSIFFSVSKSGTSLCLRLYSHSIPKS